MFDTADHGPVFQLLYRSSVRLLPDRRVEALADIFEVARWKNDALRITGALLVWQDVFVQVLEGDESVVRDLFGTIHADHRHDHVTLLDARTVTHRVFGGWSMARVGNDDGADISVERDREVAAAAPRPVETAQNTMLDAMREHARAAAEAS
jgi:hypothetical protein